MKETNKTFNQRGVVVWFTGLPSSGKTSISRELKLRLSQRSILACTFDGDKISQKRIDLLEEEVDAQEIRFNYELASWNDNIIKTKNLLKEVGVEDLEEEYNKIKNMINSCVRI